MNVRHRELNPDMVAHLSTNRARRRLICWSKPMCLPVCQTASECCTECCIYYAAIVCQRGGELFPKSDDGEMIYEDIHFFETWKVSITVQCSRLYCFYKKRPKCFFLVISPTKLWRCWWNLVCNFLTVTVTETLVLRPLLEDRGCIIFPE